MVIEMIKCQVPFSFARYGDGEYILARGQVIGEDSQARKADHWSWKGGEGRISHELRISLNHTYTDGIAMLAFPKPGSDFNWILGWFVRETSQPTQFLSSALLWMGSNRRRTINFFQDWVTKGKLEQPIIPIINEDAIPRKDIILKWAKDIIFFPDDGPIWWETEGPRAARYYQNIARAHDNTLFLVALGPVSEVVIFHMARANPNNQYVDFGSSIEDWTKGSSTRSFRLDAPEEGGWRYRKNPVNGDVENFPEPPTPTPYAS